MPRLQDLGFRHILFPLQKWILKNSIIPQEDEIETLDLKNMAEIIKAIAISSSFDHCRERYATRVDTKTLVSKFPQHFFHFACNLIIIQIPNASFVGMVQLFRRVELKISLL